MWPNVGHYAKNIILESVQPGVREALKGYKLGGFSMDKISLGAIVSNHLIPLNRIKIDDSCLLWQPFRVGGVKVYDTNVRRNEIMMDLDIWYENSICLSFRFFFK